MDIKTKRIIAQIIFPCNWDGDFHRCKGFCSIDMCYNCQRKVDKICQQIDDTIGDSDLYTGMC